MTAVALAPGEGRSGARDRLRGALRRLVNGTGSLSNTEHCSSGDLAGRFVTVCGEMMMDR